jgi:hypothetical protein
MFCENEAVAVEGKDCEAFGLAPSRHFCVVTDGSCPATHYALADHDCRVLKYSAVRQWRQCSPGTPTFAP